MNNRTVATLWIIAAVLGLAVATLKFVQGRGQQESTDRKPGETLFASFPATDIAHIEIEGADSTATLAKKDGAWTVAERDDYPANNRNVNDLVRTLSELKVTQGIQAGPSFAPRFGMDTTASNSESRGITATFKDAAGKELATISFGKNLESVSASPFGGGASGRYIRNHADESGFYAVSEIFGTLTDQPNNWLDDEFIRLEKIKSIALSKPASDDIDWTVTRDDEATDFQFANASNGEKADPAATAPLKSLLSFARFDDVVPAAEIDKRATPEKLQTATVTTFEGFTYTITLQPAKPVEDSSTDPESEAPASDNYLFSFQVAAELPSERKKTEGESEDEAAAADQIFTERLEFLTERLEKSRKLEGRTFEISKFTLEALLKDRAALISQAPASDEPQVPAPSPGTTAFTPPIEIPARPAPEQEIEEKPEEEPEGKSIEEEPPVEEIPEVEEPSLPE